MNDISTFSSSNSVLECAVIRFAGDSGDGMQLAGAWFAGEAAREGAAFATKADFPAEIRAPAGSLQGVSSFQIQFGSARVHSPGDLVDCLVAMNPAALKVHCGDLKPHGVLICNSDAFDEKHLQLAGYKENPLADPELARRFKFVASPISQLTANAVSGAGGDRRLSERCRNIFALGMVCWLFGHRAEHTLAWIEQKFGRRPAVAASNRAAFLAGIAYTEASELFAAPHVVAKADLPAGTYRDVTGNLAAAEGLITGAELAGLRLVFASYPITPATEILQELSRRKDFGVVTFQAEDEIAACCAAIGASFAGSLGATATSGPGLCLKQEAIGLAVMAELPLVVIDVQRAGPSTGLPTKTEQADLMAALFGRHGESPCVVLAVASPADAFATVVEACGLAVRFMTPVIVLSDGATAQGSEPWKVPERNELNAVEIPRGMHPYLRDPHTLARPWIAPGTAGGEHRVGGLEKDELTGAVSIDPANHERMVRCRAEKIARTAAAFGPLWVNGRDRGDVAVVGWGGTFGAIASAVEDLQQRGHAITHVHLRHLHPFHPELENLLRGFRTVVVPELNLGQLKALLRERYLIDARGINKVQGQAFRVSELTAELETFLKDGKEA